MGVSQNEGYHFGGPQNHNEDYSVLGSIVGSPHSGKLPYRDSGTCRLAVEEGLGLKGLGLTLPGTSVRSFGLTT